MDGVDAAPQGSSESVGTVIVAGLANLLIAFAKAAAGVLSGSSAMLSEAAHSLADTTTEVLLYVALKRGHRPADQTHPFGHGKESFFWAFVASMFTFVAGAGFSITHGLSSIVRGEEAADFLVSYVVLAVSFVVESVSLVKGLSQVRGAARQWQVAPLVYFQQTSDTAIKAVVLEDSAALIGLLIAALGLGLTELTGSSVWDGLASVAIGLLLLAVATVLAGRNKSLLVGQSAPPRIEEAIRSELESVREIDHVVSVVTMLIGPAALLVAAKVDFSDVVMAADIEAASERAEKRLVERFPGIRYVFLDPTPG